MGSNGQTRRQRLTDAVHCGKSDNAILQVTKASTRGTRFALSERDDSWHTVCFRTILESKCKKA
jgi:hypothetical protein